jgi:TetR/AcrR family transcriptional regulator, fatty acid metabolism regulator protein
MRSKNSSGEKTEERILSIATELFATQGYQQTSISEISKQAGLSEASIYEYFQSKEDLLHHIPAAWIDDTVQELEEQLFGVEGSFNRLRKFLWWYIRIIEKNPMTAAVVFLFLKTNRNFMSTEVYLRVRTFYGNLLEIFKQGINSGEMKPDLNPYVARSIFLGTIEHIAIRWILKDRSYSLFDHLEHTFGIFVDAFKKNA